MKTALLVLFVLAPAISMAGDRRLALPPLSLVARALVHQKMANHSKQMTELVWAVVLLDYRRTVDLAKALALEPRIARPTSGDATELNAALAPRFFDLQDQPRAKAQQLEVAAQMRDPSGVARAYGGVAETCVACHDAYLSQR